MITSKGVKRLAALFKKTEPPTIAILPSGTGQLWAKSFVFELPADEFSKEVVAKYGGDPIRLDDVLRSTRWEPPYDRYTWRDVLVPKVAGQVVEPDWERFVGGDDELEEVDVLKFVTAEGEEVYLQAEFYEFFGGQLLQPVFKVHPTVKSWPALISIWEGSGLVGLVAPWDPKDGRRVER